MSNKPLVTGFNRYGRLATNPSEELVDWARTEFGGRIRTAVLPTEYIAAFEQVRKSILASNPSVALMFGYTSRANGLRLERLASNRVGSKGPDNSGLLLQGQIDPQAPSVEETSVAVEELVQRLNRREDVANRSENAGTYVCNFIYYKVLNWLRESRLDVPCLFVHISRPPHVDRVVARGTNALIEAAIKGELPLMFEPRNRRTIRQQAL